MKNPFFEWKIRGRQRRVWWRKNGEITMLTMFSIYATIMFLITMNYCIKGILLTIK